MATSSNLENLAKIGQLKAESPAQSEIDGLIASGRKRLKDAKNPTNALESRFELAYSAAHAFSLAALRWRGYRFTPDELVQASSSKSASRRRMRRWRKISNASQPI